MIVAPFDAPVLLSSIPNGKTLTVLQGTSKTSLERDSKNKDNWVGLKMNAEYIGKKNKHSKKQYNAIVEFAIVSL